MYLQAAWQLPHAPDGSPYAAATITSNWVVGIRNVTATATAARPVVCGDSLTTAKEDSTDPNPTNVGWTYCMDSQVDVTSGASDYGIVTSGAHATGAPGSLVSMPFILRSGNVPFTTTPAATRATSTLPGATLAVTPEAVPQPPLNGDSVATVAVGIPANAAPGVCDITFTAAVAGTLLRTGVGTLTVVAPTGGGRTAGGGGARAKRKITTILPKGLPVATARAGGVPVLIGSNVAGPAVVRFQQGPKRRPTVSLRKRTRMKAPGPVKVTFRSRKLVKGPFRITVRVRGKVVKTVNGRLVR
ncbi:MAG TPA: hypothetical protein VFG74_15385 [Miltoncostaeaceae bacterium]|nr:hypothetical protein [Miltoncostaeaceae bacterium]